MNKVSSVCITITATKFRDVCLLNIFTDTKHQLDQLVEGHVQFPGGKNKSSA